VTAVTAGEYALSVEPYVPEDTGGDTASEGPNGVADDDANEETRGGCGCDGGAGALNAMGALAALALVARRRARAT
jgi:uncharacterized protein (TIGR03382 family)